MEIHDRHPDSLRIYLLNEVDVPYDLVTFSTTSEPWVRSLNTWNFLFVTVDPALLYSGNMRILKRNLRNIKKHGVVIKAQEALVTEKPAEDMVYRYIEEIKV